MKCKILPFGNAGWHEKKRIVEEVIAMRRHPPFLYNDVLLLMASSRSKRVYGKLFLDALRVTHGAHALVQPEMQTLHQFMQKLYSRLQGPRLVDENSRLILLEGIIKEQLAGQKLFNQSPDLLAPSLSSVLAKTIEQLSAAGIGPKELERTVAGSEYSDKAQVQILITTFTRYAAALREYNLTDPSGMKALLNDRFDPLWIAGYERVIIDGIHHADVLETGFLKKMISSGNITFLVDAPSPDLLGKARESHPLRITKDFLSMLSLLQKAETTSSTTPPSLYLASALFSDQSFADIIKDAPDPGTFFAEIDLVSAITMREEVSFIAGNVKQSLRKGTPPDSVLVAFPALDEYGGLVEEIFNDYGIPYNRALGRQLSTSAVATALISLLRSCREDYSAPSLLRVFSSPFLKFGENPALAAALDRFLRDRKITGGKEKILSELKHRKADDTVHTLLTQNLSGLFAALEPFSLPSPAPLAFWMERLGELLAWSGTEARVALIKGPLNVNLQAYKKLDECLLSLKQAGRIFPDYHYTFSEWLFLLKKTFMHTRFQVPPEDEGGVQILGLEESLNIPWREIYLGGLIDGKFPQRLPQNIFLPEHVLESMGVRTREQSRLNAAYHFYRLLQSADRIMLTYPENAGDRPVVPSPFLEELTPFRKAGLLNRAVGASSGIQFTLKKEDSKSLPELAKAVALSDTGNNEHCLQALSEVSAALPLLQPRLNSMQNAFVQKLHFRDRAVTPPVKPRFRVTELEAYINCPYDYYITHVLRISPIEEVSQDISPLDRGSKVHAVLRNFYLSWGYRQVSGENCEEARLLLRNLAEAAFDNETDTFRNRREKQLFLSIMAERFLDAEVEFWNQGLKPVSLEYKIEEFPLLLTSQEHVDLSARIDRIDADADGNFIIVDYKTGKYPPAKMNTEQQIFQLPLYAVMVQHSLSRKKAESPDLSLGSPIGLAYYDLAGKTGGGARDVVLFNKDARHDHPSSKPKASAKSTEEFAIILKQSLEKARAAVEGILAGAFPAEARDENKCRYCSNRELCRSGISDDE